MMCVVTQPCCRCVIAQWRGGASPPSRTSSAIPVSSGSDVQPPFQNDLPPASDHHRHAQPSATSPRPSTSHPARKSDELHSRIRSGFLKEPVGAAPSRPPSAKHPGARAAASPLYGARCAHLHWLEPIITFMWCIALLLTPCRRSGDATTPIRAERVLSLRAM